MVLMPWMVLTNTLGNTLSYQRADAPRARAPLRYTETPPCPCIPCTPYSRRCYYSRCVWFITLSLHPLHLLLQHSLMVLMPCVMVLN